MVSLAVLKTLLRECVTSERCARRNEPDLVMDDPAKVAAYTRAGREDGVMAPVYLFHCAQICEVVRPGDTVVDLGCGPATQLIMVARLNPDARFIGVDLSPEMIARARAGAAEHGLDNVTFVLGDITKLAFLADQSVDVLCSTVAFHHLPDDDHLQRAFAEVARVLKAEGGLYIVDFGRLKSEKSIHYFAYQYSDRQAELFTLDYLHSLQAAFALTDFKSAVARQLGGRARLYSTFGLPYMVVVKQARRNGEVIERVRAELAALRAALPAHHQRDLDDLCTLFRLGGLASPLLANRKA